MNMSEKWGVILKHSLGLYENSCTVVEIHFKLLYVGDTDFSHHVTLVYMSTVFLLFFLTLEAHCKE